MVYLIKAQIHDSIQTVGKFHAPNEMQAMFQAVAKYPKLLKNCRMEASILPEEKEYQANAESTLRQ